MKIGRLTLLSLLLVPLFLFVAVPRGAAAQPATGTGTAVFQGIAGTITNLHATYNAVTNTTTITGTFTDTLGNVTNFTTTLIGASGTCQILHLELGPVDLNVLGLMVHLDRVVLDITAQSGPGNLLGNLLCAVAHLLDNNPLGNLAGLLNRIFLLL
jgi:hypothetical protein